VFLLNLRYFLCYHVMVNKVVYSTARDGAVKKDRIRNGYFISSKVICLRPYINARYVLLTAWKVTYK